MLKQRDKEEINTIETHLKNYHSYKAGIINLKKKIEYMHLPYITSNLHSKEGSKGTFAFYSTTETAAIDRLESPEIKKANKTIQLYEMLVGSIDHTISQLPEEDQCFIKLRYFQNCSILKISDELGYSVRQVHRIRQRVLNHLLISLIHLPNSSYLSIG